MLLGTAACWLVNPIFGYVFLAFSAFSIYLIIRRFLCTSCYYCKSCTKGLAKLSILMRGANRIPGLNKGSIISLTVFAYVVLAVIPGWLLVDSILQGFDLLKLAVLSCLALVSVYGIAARIKNGDKVITA